MRISRRTLICASVGGLVGLDAWSDSDLQSLYSEKGDPTIASEPAYINPKIIRRVSQSGAKLVIPDSDPNFSKKLVELALTLEGVNRWDESWTKIRDMLEVFGCPFSRSEAGKTVYTAFCAAAVGYCAACIYSPNDHSVDALRRMIRIVDFYNFWPSSAVRFTAQAAAAKGRWVPSSELKTAPEAGSLVCFDWGNSKDPLSVDHCGIVLGTREGLIQTIEFNTSGLRNSSQRDGGFVCRKTRPFNSFVKGFVRTKPLQKA